MAEFDRSFDDSFDSPTEEPSEHLTDGLLLDGRFQSAQVTHLTDGISLRVFNDELSTQTRDVTDQVKLQDQAVTQTAQLATIPDGIKTGAVAFGFDMSLQESINIVATEIIELQSAINALTSDALAEVILKELILQVVEKHELDTSFTKFLSDLIAAIDIDPTIRDQVQQII